MGVEAGSVASAEGEDATGCPSLCLQSTARTIRVGRGVHAR